ncbi:MAG TPA: hypothetical protein VHH73_03035 [Verrucomicrobiae bacterium]|nr:hypothetical protein [Verrucomicrobiae bacterium]
MKRSQSIRLVLLGGTVAVLAGCSHDPDNSAPPVSTNNVYTNNHYVSGAGYYHAYYHAWYPHPWDFYSPGLGYYRGGLWHPTSVPNPLPSSRPSAEAVRTAQAANPSSSGNGGSHYSHSGVRRGGFGHFFRGGGS